MNEVKREIETGLRYISITGPDINNGIGCRVTLWVTGCNRGCPHCHNKELWLYNQGESFEKAYPILEEKMSKDYVRGITFSGGDPLDQSNKALLNLYDMITWVKNKFPEKDIWMYTGGVYEEIVREPIINDILGLCDVLVDGRYEHEKRDISLPFRGSTNQRIIDLKKTFKKGKVVIKEME